VNVPVLGAARSRVEGPEKVTGRVRYTADYAPEDALHAVVVTSTAANARIAEIDERLALEVPSVVTILTHRNAPRVDARKQGPTSTLLFLLQNDVVQFDRQPVAVVIARTLEQAAEAADRIRVSYRAETPQTDLDAAPVAPVETIFGQPGTHARGNPDAPLPAGSVSVRQTYRTPTEHHNPMETHATIARWDSEGLTLWDSTQWAFGVRERMAQVFGIDPSRVRVIAPYVGGAFGSKGTPWSHVALAAMASKVTNRPVKLVVTRPQMFGFVGHRPKTEQRVELAAARDGALIVVKHVCQNETSIADEFVEPCGVFSRDLYAVPNYFMSHRLRRLNVSKPTYQRGPGESTGSFAMESAMDELAYALAIDPLELRLRNYSEVQPNNGKPYSGKCLRECYALAAERFGWSARNPAPRSTVRGRMLVGTGMATASRATHRSGSHARIRIDRAGEVTVAVGTIEQGTGSPTVFAQVAAEILGVPFERVRFLWGDTDLPQAPLAAGSQTAASVGSAVAAAAQALRRSLDELGGSIPNDGLEIVHAEEPPESEEAYATQAFGAHFAEVEVDPDLGTVRVTRFVGAFDGGRILNEKTARSQLLGGVVWGISMALFEQTRYDRRTARIMNANLSEYLVPTNADVPNAELLLVSDDDRHANPIGVRGIGEVGICGSGAAVANAVYHATGVRVRDLPITPEKLLAQA